MSLRIIQIGTGSTVHAAHIAKALRELPEHFQHLGIVETDPLQKQEAEKNVIYQGLPFLTWETALTLKPDAFFVETDEPRLVATAIQCLETGFPVFMDKPGSGNSAEFHQMCRIAGEKKLPFAAGYMYRSNPAVRKALEFVHSGQLGRIVSFEGQMSCMAGASYHEKLRRFPGGMMYYLGCHIIDLMVQCCGFPAETLPLHTATHSCGVECVDHALCVFRYPECCATVKSSASEFNGFDRRCLYVGGTKGSVEIRPLEKPEGNGYFSAELRLTLNNNRPYADGSERLAFPLFRRYDTMLTDFADYVRGKRENPYTPAYEAKLHDLILEAQGHLSEMP